MSELDRLIQDTANFGSILNDEHIKKLKNELLKKHCYNDDVDWCECYQDQEGSRLSKNGDELIEIFQDFYKKRLEQIKITLFARFDKVRISENVRVTSKYFLNLRNQIEALIPQKKDFFKKYPYSKQLDFPFFYNSIDAPFWCKSCVFPHI